VAKLWQNKLSSAKSRCGAPGAGERPIGVDTCNAVDDLPVIGGEQPAEIDVSSAVECGNDREDLPVDDRFMEGGNHDSVTIEAA
jgi:hypothetical protein